MPQRPLEEIGLGTTAQMVIAAISILPFVGLIIGSSYATRRNAATRHLGRRLLFYAVVLHIFYVFCVCPAAAFWALNP